jgi:proliferating cell nuclear antigen
MPKALELKTVQGNPFKGLCEAVKEILTEANFECDKNGIRVVAMDSTRTVLVHLKLEADQFEQYMCPEKLTLGINLINLYKLIKLLGPNDSLSFYVEEDSKCQLGIRIENPDKNSKINLTLNLLDLNDDSYNIPPTEFKSILTMPSTDFQKLCRDLNTLADTVEIKSLANKLIFSIKGDFSSGDIIMHESVGSLSWVQNDDPENIIQGEFSLKHLCLFTKCTPLCQSIKIYFKNDYPIIVEYAIASLGTIKLCLAPKMDSSS